jgi:hypothetical protein
LLALGISTIAGVAAMKNIGFWQGASLALAFQFIIGALHTKWMQVRAVIALRAIDVQEYTEKAKQSLKLTCPCAFKNEQIVPLRFDAPNVYRCFTCNKNLSVLMDIKTALSTEVIDIDIAHQEIVEKMQNVPIVNE